METKTFSVSAPELWNKLPLSVKNADSVELFKCKLKSYLFDIFVATAPMNSH